MSDFFYTLYKGISQLVMPVGITIIGLILAGLLIALKKRKAGLICLVTAVVWLWMWSTPVWSDFVRSKLESAYPYRSPGAYPRADAIVVLGGGIRGFAGPDFPHIDLNRAADREFFAAQLFRAHKSARIILSGGADPLHRTGVAASGMKIFLINLGIPSANILLETRSRNTAENRDEVSKMMQELKGRKILLVTSALHMKRSVLLFSNTGLLIIPAPSDFEVVPAPASIYRLLPDAEALENSSRACREIIGISLYHLGFY
ncbi:MAG: YdcF family protein [Bacteroidales bacterium]|nr:YdcF family protein [Bacteroidales bacterium]